MTEGSKTEENELLNMMMVKKLHQTLTVLESESIIITEIKAHKRKHKQICHIYAMINDLLLDTIEGRS